MGKRIFALWCLVMLIGAVTAGASRADMYSYVDANGVRHFSNVPTDRRYEKISWVHSRPLTVFSGSHSINPADVEAFLAEVGGDLQLDPLLIKAVIKAESNFDFRAVSPKGAQGLMQLMPDTCKDMKVADPFDPRQNIRGGARYLRRMLDLFDGEVELALAAYNAGPEVVKSIGGVPDYPETTAYVQRVLRHYKRYQSVAMLRGDG